MWCCHFGFPSCVLGLGSENIIMKSHPSSLQRSKADLERKGTSLERFGTSWLERTLERFGMFGTLERTSERFGTIEKSIRLERKLTVLFSRRNSQKLLSEAWGDPEGGWCCLESFCVASSLSFLYSRKLSTLLCIFNDPLSEFSVRH